MEWWDYFEKEFFLPSETRDLVKARLPPNEHSTNICLAFDFIGSEITTKAYFFPILKSLATGKTGSELVFDAIRRLDRENFRLKEALAPIEDFINAFPPGTAPKLEFIAIDLIAPLESRIKIYYRSPITALNKVINMYTLGGRLSSPSVESGVEILRGLWPLVLNLPENYPPDQELPFVPHRTTGTCFNFEIRPNDPLPQPKVYIPVRHYAKSDLAVAQNVAIFFEQQGWNDLARNYVKDFNSVYSHNDLENTTHTQSHIGFGYKKKTGVAITIYLAPKIFTIPAGRLE
jgi:DMATS type aromatic prenyltransferase